MVSLFQQTAKSLIWKKVTKEIHVGGLYQLFSTWDLWSYSKERKGPREGRHTGELAADSESREQAPLCAVMKASVWAAILSTLSGSSFMGLTSLWKKVGDRDLSTPYIAQPQHWGRVSPGPLECFDCRKESTGGKRLGTC